MKLLAESVLFALALMPVVGLALFVNRSRQFIFAALFLVLFAFDYAITTFPTVYDFLVIPGANWNWTGKLLSMTWAFLFILISPISFREVGFTLRQRHGSVLPATVITAAVAVVSLVSGAALAGTMTFSTETIFYQLTMPGFAEELTYRGIFLVLLHRALTVGRESPADWWPAMITTLAFGLIHGLGLDGWNITFNLLYFVLSLFGAAIFVWLRELTGSLVFPILAHNVSNTFIYLMGVL
jgi:uncharacterized protein